MKNQLILICLFSLLLVNCEKDKLSKILNFQQFTIEVPAIWNSFTKQGYDLKTGGITNGKDKLTYDFG